MAWWQTIDVALFRCLIRDHYGITSQIAFYLSEARAAVATEPLAYSKSTARPKNQFYFWPGYRETRHGQNALFVRELDRPRLKPDWFGRWLRNDKDLFEAPPPPKDPLPAQLLQEFGSVSEWGIVEIRHRSRLFRRLQIFVCRDLR